ncbi:MAG TPA: hypothetical protein PK624_02080 [Spirochaetota bacterium]|nr:hypothetical protein [Spirochaetota bacterium]HOF32694.1 hypothetical protein [Spirochaetota bacterium]HOR43564.1 hypothetical protein [Spirochaetota bacterium]HPK55724.1 hypothetical protein [Spirochaetota bacterium]
MRKLLFAVLFSFSLFADDTLIVRNTKVSYDINMSVIRIEWENLGYNSYAVLRSEKFDSDFTQIAIVENSLVYEDSNIEKGVNYWYKIIPAAQTDAQVAAEKYISEENYVLFHTPVNSNSSEAQAVEAIVDSNPNSMPVYSAYSSKPIPLGLPLDKLLSEKKQTIKAPKDPVQLTLHNRRINYLKKFYMNSIKLSLVMSFSKQYINNGELRIFDNFTNYELKEGERKVVFFGSDYDYAVEFESKKLFNILNGSEDDDLKELLLKNAETFCLYSGEKPYLDKDGKTRYIHTFDAVGLSTRYLKNDKDWKKKTIMVSTSRKDLQQKLQNAQRR